MLVRLHPRTPMIYGPFVQRVQKALNGSPEAASTRRSRRRLKTVAGFGALLGTFIAAAVKATNINLRFRPLQAHVLWHDQLELVAFDRT